MARDESFYREMNLMQRKMYRLFGDLFSDLLSDKNEMIDEISENYRKAFTNFKETENDFMIYVEIPGIEKDKIRLNITDKGLEIKAEKKQEEKLTKKEDEYSYTKSYAGFYQAFDVPENADLEKIDAFYKNGMLTIRLPKKSLDKNKKEIPIK